MNWMKKLLQFLNSEEGPIENKYEHVPKNKNVEARVTYEYPKGNFRFPIIPDQQQNNRSNVVPKERPTRAPKKRETTQKIERVRDEKQPFRPTETPSPVFGLSSRQHRSQSNSQQEPQNIIEYELPTLHRENKHKSVEHKDWNTVPDEVAATILVENENLVESTKTYKEQQPQSEEETSLSIQEEVELLKSIRRGRVDEVEEEVVDIQHENELPEFLQDEEEVPEKLEITESVLQHELDEVAHSTVEEQINKEPEPEPEQRRSNIPFNVLMFKKDKQRITQNEENKSNEQPNPQPIKEEVISVEESSEKTGYAFPNLTFLNSPPSEQFDDNQWLLQQKNTLDLTLRNFKVRAKVVNVTQGPAVTRFEVHPEPGVKVNKITNLSDDIKLSLAAKDIRIEAPIPGKNTIGIEVPNKKSKPVLLKEILQSPEFSANKSPLTVALGLDISGKPIVTDLQKMPHGLIAGATGSGKSVCINAMLVSLLYKATPDEVKLLLIDPKMVELAPYNHIPHLISPVITDAKAATASLKWAVEEMERRYELFAHTGVRDIGRYNEMVRKYDEKSGKLPYLVIIIDELADLMMVAPGDVEDSICRIAQKARACGIHLILATQRPSVDVITGLIKANIPTRIAFSVSSQVDSRTIIDSSGADKLLGKGDMLFLENGASKPIRVQGNFVSDDEIEQVVEFAKSEMKPTYMFEQDELLKKTAISNDEDELFLEACEFVLEHGGASTSSLQRRFRIGYNRAARLIDMMEDQGIISEARGSKPREVLITEEELAMIHENE